MKQGTGAISERPAAAPSGRCRPDTVPQTGQLRYVCEPDAGITRMRGPNGFAYRHPNGRVVRNPATLERIRRLAIPPAWEGVWICADPDGHIQATGRDARGRKQYRYHPAWREMRDADKFERLEAFGQALPEIRRQAAADLAHPDLTKAKIVALVVSLMDETLLRVGNEEYARSNEAYGLTTLRDRHALVCGSEIRLVFRGKGGKTQLATIRNRRLARAVKRSQELPGEVLFQYLDESGHPVPVSSGDVNDYLRSIAGREFSAKEFRTWGGTLIAARELAGKGGLSGGARDALRRVNEALDVASAHLGNTRAVARRSYVHPAIIEAFLDGALSAAWEQALAEAVTTEGLSAEEQALLIVLGAPAVGPEAQISA
jgi:DNA topoisomerase-1